MQFQKSSFQVQVVRGIYVTVKFFEILHVRSQGQTLGTFSISADLNCNNYKNVFCTSIWREFLCPEQVEFFGFPHLFFPQSLNWREFQNFNSAKTLCCFGPVSASISLCFLCLKTSGICGSKHLFSEICRSAKLNESGIVSQIQWMPQPKE